MFCVQHCMFLFEFWVMYRKWVIVFKIGVSWHCELKSLPSLHAKLVLKGLIESDKFTIGEILSHHCLFCSVCFAPLITCTIALA